MQVSEYRRVLREQGMLHLSSAPGPESTLAAITLLRKACNHPALLRDPLEEAEAAAGPAAVDPCVSGKMQVLAAMLGQLAAEPRDKSVPSPLCSWPMPLSPTPGPPTPRSMVLVSSSTRVLDLLGVLCGSLGLSTCRIDGSTPPQERQGVVKGFNELGRARVLLLSSRAGGAGLNLVGANRLVLFDSDWNPAIVSPSPVHPLPAWACVGDLSWAPPVQASAGPAGHGPDLAGGAAAALPGVPAADNWHHRREDPAAAAGQGRGGGPGGRAARQGQQGGRRVHPRGAAGALHPPVGPLGPDGLPPPPPLLLTCHYLSVCPSARLDTACDTRDMMVRREEVAAAWVDCSARVEDPVLRAALALRPPRVSFVQEAGQPLLEASEQEEEEEGGVAADVALEKEEEEEGGMIGPPPSNPEPVREGEEETESESGVSRSESGVGQLAGVEDLEIPDDLECTLKPEDTYFFQ